MGNGNSIRLWDDLWIPDNLMFKPVFVHVQSINFVSDFLDPNSHGWNVPLVTQTFLL